VSGGGTEEDGGRGAEEVVVGGRGRNAEMEWSGEVATGERIGQHESRVGTGNMGCLFFFFALRFGIPSGLSAACCVYVYAA
jgi:hypothetical protein